LYLYIPEIENYYGEMNQQIVNYKSGTAMPKPILAITIRTFAFDEAVRTRLESHFTIDYINASGQRLNKSELKAAIRNADAVIAGTESFSEEVMDAAPNLKMISRVGVGLDSVDLDAASKRKIRIFITAASATQPVAEHTLALIFSLVKRLSEYTKSSETADHGIKQASILQGKKVGIIGLGRIGSRVGELLSCLGCSIIFFDPYLAQIPNPRWEKAKSLDHLLQCADIITLHVPAQKNNIPLLNREAFNQCREGVILVNTARGSLVDEQELFDALRRGTVAGAGLDVTMKEPYCGPLLSFPQVIITPHVASNTTESRRDMENEAVENLINAVTKGYE
jgi:D-3-phosphoglycerate dehydrogenase / 2-oxoglutarate reductase